MTKGVGCVVFLLKQFTASTNNSKYHSYIGKYYYSFLPVKQYIFISLLLYSSLILNFKLQHIPSSLIKSQYACLNAIFLTAVEMKGFYYIIYTTVLNFIGLTF